VQGDCVRVTLPIYVNSCRSGGKAYRLGCGIEGRLKQTRNHGRARFAKSVFRELTNER
jgi:hypothetical protein